MAHEDISDILAGWEFDPGHKVRIIVARNGRSVMQVRLPLGIEQYEMEGRPDGRTPGGFDSMLDAVEARLTGYIVSNGSDSGFALTADETSELKAEGILYYQRYTWFLNLEFYDLLERDTAHNLNVCEIIDRYCNEEPARNEILQYRPLIIGLHAGARAMAMLRGEVTGNPRTTLYEAMQHVDRLDSIETPVFQFERMRAKKYMQAIIHRTQERGDLHEDYRKNVREEESDIGRLQRELMEAINIEDYERAARIRDMLSRDTS